jgi:hypothetical protein
MRKFDGERFTGESRELFTVAQTGLVRNHG